MTPERKKVLLTNIANYAAFVSAYFGEEIVVDIMKKYRVNELEELSTQECEDVFSCLFQYEADAKD